MTVFVSPPYDERVHHLALGIEPRSALTGSRLAAGVDVRWENHPSPVGAWRRWRPAETLTDVLPRLERHHTGRFVRRYGDGVVRPMLVRLVDPQRRVVPRRLAIRIPTEEAVVAATGPDLVPDPAWRRTFAVHLFPGAAAPLGAGATVLRGRVVRDAGGGPVPVRWARVRATTPLGEPLGWAHGDDRGEFVLVLSPAAGALTVPADPLQVVLTVGAPPPTPPVEDPDLARVDPLWDLPVEQVVPTPTTPGGSLLAGREMVPGSAEVTPTSPPVPHLVRHGRQSSVVLTIA